MGRSTYIDWKRGRWERHPTRRRRARYRRVALGAAQPGREGWCSQANPMPGCDPPAGTCLPTDPVMLARVQQLQRLINAYNAAHKLPLVQVNGRIEPPMVAALKTIISATSASNYVAVPDSCDNVAASSGTILAALSMVISDPAVPDPKPTCPVSYAERGVVVHPPCGIASVPKWIWLAGAGVVGVLLLARRKKA